MSKQIIFRPRQEYITINPLEAPGELRYILHTTNHIPKNEITIKYAFPNSWQEDSPEIKVRARQILIAILDIGNFDIDYYDNMIEIAVPTKTIVDDLLLEGLNPFEIQLVVKLQRISEEGSFQIKAKQVLLLESLPQEQPWLLESDTADVLLQPEFEFSNDPFYQKNQQNENDNNKQISYGGIISIDFGTTNSVLVVRDPHFAAEEISKDLSRDQWKSLTKWMDEWLIEHISMITPRETDLFLEKLAQQIPGMDIPPCGSLSIDIWQELGKVTEKTHKDFLAEVIHNLSILDAEKNIKTLRNISHELFNGLERVIYSRTLESQRYFVLELDSNAGAKPISSTLQIVASPQDQEKIQDETEIEMGVRVNLLMRSATLGDADIRQFALSIKRYFGRNEYIELVPSETASVPTKFHCDMLCLLAYKKLLERAILDIQKKSRRNLLEYADKPHTIVATFPTTYPASLRRKLRDLLYELDIHDIDTRFDEGSASLIYYVWREVCADPVCGMEGLMSRCRVDKHKRPYQNILLYDIGGGTTDIALIQLIYEEIPIFEPTDKTATSGGSYFRITPRLLGSTGHSFIGGDLITLWLFRLIKTKLADNILSFITDKKIDPPTGSKMDNLLSSLSSNLIDRQGIYKKESLLGWTYAPQENIRQYEALNDAVIDIVVPTKYKNMQENTPHFFTLWHLTEDVKKSLGTPLTTHSGSGLGYEWPEQIVLDSVQLYYLVINMHPWLENYDLGSKDIKIVITQNELCKFAKGLVSDSLQLAMNLAKSRLRIKNVHDKVDRLILSGLSCNLKIIQEEAKNIFKTSEGLFNFTLANVFFDQELAKTSVAMGACIGRYLESVRIDPTNEKTRQMLREGYDQIELVVENLFTHLACRLVYDSLVAMVIMFDYGQELDKRSYVDRKPVARTPMDNLKPVQEKFWIYRVDFEGANPLYLGLIDAEAVAMEHNFSDFRKFRELYLVGFEADAELFVRGFFIPRGPKNILAQSFIIPDNSNDLVKDIVQIHPQGYLELSHSISSQEIFKRKAVIAKGTKMIDTIEYPDGSKYKCAISEPLSVREMYDFYIEGSQSSNKEPQLIGHFHLYERDVDEVYLVCDERGKVILLYFFKYDIKIWADIDYVPQKIDSQYDPFCGQH